MSFLNKNICLPTINALFIAAAFFVGAYILYRILLFVGRKIFVQGTLARRIVEEVRLPIAWLLMEVAALFALHTIELSEQATRIAFHTTTLFMIATVGWYFCALTRAFYHNFMAKVGNGVHVDLERRSMVTQVLLLYRILMFAICAVTIATLLLTFPYIRGVGVGILGSAGIAGIALGIAARPILLNLMAGLQIAATKTLKIGDAIHIEGDFARVESLHLTHVVARTWDMRRIILPISYFIDKPFQNWEAANTGYLGVAIIYCDYSAPIHAIRAKVAELLAEHPKWNKKDWSVQVSNCTEKSIEVRLTATASDVTSSMELRAFLRERIIDFLQSEHPSALPCSRNKQVE